jgi:hypothetical protein
MREFLQAINRLRTQLTGRHGFAAAACPQLTSDSAEVWTPATTPDGPGTPRLGSPRLGDATRPHQPQTGSIIGPQRRRLPLGTAAQHPHLSTLSWRLPFLFIRQQAKRRLGFIPQNLPPPGPGQCAWLFQRSDDPGAHCAAMEGAHEWRRSMGPTWKWPSGTNTHAILSCPRGPS